MKTYHLRHHRPFMNRRYTQQNVIHSLQLLGQHLKKHHEDAEIQLVGGAAWMLGYKIRKDVGDIDAMWDTWSDMTLRPWIDKLSANNIFLHSKWLNNDAQDVVEVENGKWERYAKYGGLDVLIPDEKTTAAMMVAALKCVNTSASDHDLSSRYAQDIVAFAKFKKWSAQTLLHEAQQAYGSKKIPPVCEEWVYRLLPTENIAKKNTVEEVYGTV